MGTCPLLLQIALIRLKKGTEMATFLLLLWVSLGEERKRVWVDTVLLLFQLSFGECRNWVEIFYLQIGPKCFLVLLPSGASG